MDLVAEFRDYCLYDLELRPRTVKMYVRRLEYAQRLTGRPVHKIKDIDLDLIKRRCIDGELPLGRESVKGIMVVVRRFHYWGAAKGKWNLNGISLVRTIKVPRNRANPLTVDEIRELKAACERPLEFRVIYGIVYTGMRIGEIAPIEGSWWRSGWLRFEGEKNSGVREVPIHPELERVKWQILAHPPTYDSTLQRNKRRLEKKTGIRFVTHQLRDTFSTFLQDLGASYLCRKELMGHDLGLDGIYTWVSRREKAEVVARLPY
jgi:integrase